MLQEEVRKLHIALSEERKVTEKLSRNLELEKRRSESLEQKAKNAFRKSSQANTSNTAVFLPEEMRYRDEQLADKMEKYTDQIERVTMSLQECEEKLTGFEIQVKISGLATVAYFLMECSVATFGVNPQLYLARFKVTLIRDLHHKNPILTTAILTISEALNFDFLSISTLTNCKIPSYSLFKGAKNYQNSRF